MCNPFLEAALFIAVFDGSKNDVVFPWLYLPHPGHVVGYEYAVQARL